MRRPRHRGVGHVATVALAAAIAAPPAAGADVLRPIWNPSGSYGESFTFVADLDDGAYVQVTLGVTNLGPGTSHGICRAVVVLPGRPPWSGHVRVSSDAWDYRRPPDERLVVGRCAAWNGATAAGVEAAIDGATVRLEYAAPLRPVAPPGSRFRVGDESFRGELLLYRAAVTATLEVPGAPPRRATGGGYADHSRGDVPTKALARRWVRFRALRGDAGLLVLGREARDGRFEPLWSAASPPRFTEHGSFRVERSDAASPPTFRIELPGDGGMEIDSGPLLYRDAPVEELGLLGKLVKPFVGSPVTWVYRATARPRGAPEVHGILEVELADE